MSEAINSDESYATDTPLVELFGEGARARMISVFATKRNREFNVTELSRLAGVSRTAVYDHLDDLDELGFVESVDSGGTKRYTASDSDVSEKLYELNGVTLTALLEIDG